MNRIDISKYAVFSELPLEQFENFKFSVYVLDFNWNYLFVNQFVKQNLRAKGEDLVGKNMWETFKELANDPSFLLMKKNSENGKETNMITTSPISSQKINIVGYNLKDCYLFFSSILPNKEDLIHELRGKLEKNAKLVR